MSPEDDNQEIEGSSDEVQSPEQTDGVLEETGEAQELVEGEEEKKGRDEEAIEFDLESQVEEFRRQIEEEPENCVHHYNLGEALQELRQFDEAQSEFETALELDDDNAFSAIIHFGLGNLFYSQLMGGASAEVVKSSVGLISEHKDTNRITHVEDEDYRLPIEAFQKSIEKIPFLKADEDLVEYVSEQAPRQIATAYYKWASDLIDKSRQLNHYGGEIDDVKRALKFLKKTIEIDPSNSAASLLNNLAKKMLAEGWTIYDNYGFLAKEIPGTG